MHTRLVSGSLRLIRYFRPEHTVFRTEVDCGILEVLSFVQQLALYFFFLSPYNISTNQRCKFHLITHSHNINNTQPIGIFDSGVGGLSIAKCIAEHLPNEKLIYVADSAHAPYGDIEIVMIEQRVNLIADWLMSQNCKAIVIACNTATVNAIDQLRARLSIPIIGVEPAIKPAALASKNKKIAILATQATAANQRFLALVEKYKNGAEVIIQPCPGLVELIEQGKINSLEFINLLTSYLTPLQAQQVDTIVLGCTHYPFAVDAIKKVVGANVTIVETALPVTKQLSHQLNLHHIAASTPSAHNPCFYSSLANEQQTQLFSQLWQKNITVKNFTHSF